MPSLPALSGVLEEGKRAGVAPALSAAVFAQGRLVHATFHGSVPVPESPARPLEETDLFDVASLTKVATTTVAARLVASGKLDLDRPIAEALPSFSGSGKRAVTSRHLLAHSSGLPAYRAFFELVRKDPVGGKAFNPLVGEAALPEPFLRGKELIFAAVMKEPLVRPCGEAAVYSDVGFLALGFLLERLSGVPFPRLARGSVFDPLKLASTGYCDMTLGEGQMARFRGRAFAPTGYSPARQKIVREGVNDDNAWALGGGAPHAGVFSTALDVALLGQAWLDALAGRGDLLPREVARHFVKKDPTPGSARALGWDTPSGETALGTRLGRGPKGAVGHLGFTGTSLWLDLDTEVSVVLLTNHIHPSGQPDRPLIRSFRRRFHDTLAEALGL